MIDFIFPKDRRFEAFFLFHIKDNISIIILKVNYSIFNLQNT